MQHVIKCNLLHVCESKFGICNSCLLSLIVPSTVPMMHQLSRAPDSITLSWPQPDRPNGDILEYQLRYYDKVNPSNIQECACQIFLNVITCNILYVHQGSDVDSALSVYSETNTVTVNSLIPGSIYAFQIRARNERGYGPFSNTIYFTTLPLGIAMFFLTSGESLSITAVKLTMLCRLFKGRNSSWSTE